MTHFTVRNSGGDSQPRHIYTTSPSHYGPVSLPAVADRKYQCFFQKMEILEIFDIFVSPQNFYVTILTSNVLVQRGGALGGD